MPRDPHESEALGEFLARQYPDLSRDALNRIKSGKGLFVSRHKLAPAFSDRDYARLVLMRALGVFTEITGLPSTRLHLSDDEKELLKPVLDPEPEPRTQRRS